MDRDAATRAFERAVASDMRVFGDFFLSRFLGFDIRYEDDACIVRFPVEAHLYNPQGTLHGGIIALAMDVSVGHLIRHATGQAGITLEMKTQFLRALTGGTARAEGRFLRRGRSVCFMESRLADEAGALCAVMSSTWTLPRG